MRRYSLTFMLVLLFAPQPASAQTERFQGQGIDLGNLAPPGSRGTSTLGPSTGRVGTMHGPKFGDPGHIPDSVTRTYQQGINPDLSPAQALYQQNRAIQTYSNLGYQFEAKKQWENAEKAFKYVLKVSVLRDGVGSPKMIPILQHLAVVASEQKHYPEAIGFQDRVVSFAKNSGDATAQVMAQVSLAKLYFFNQDMDNAESTMREAYVLTQQLPSLPDDKKKVVTRTFGKILRAENKDAEAVQVDPDPNDSEVSTKPETTPANDSSSSKPNDAAAAKGVNNGATKGSDGTTAKATDSKTSQNSSSIVPKASETATSSQKSAGATNN
ncbi:MAG TPA: tetratricopeptide repeat protein [Oculatellaceae cyanobacterium]